MVTKTLPKFNSKSPWKNGCLEDKPPSYWGYQTTFPGRTVETSGGGGTVDVSRNPMAFLCSSPSWGNSLQFDVRIFFRWVGWNSTTNQPVIGGVYWQNPCFFLLEAPGCHFLTSGGLGSWCWGGPVGVLGWTCEIIDTGPGNNIVVTQDMFFGWKVRFLGGKRNPWVFHKRVFNLLQLMNRIWMSSNETRSLRNFS